MQRLLSIACTDNMRQETHAKMKRQLRDYHRRAALFVTAGVLVLVAMAVAVGSVDLDACAMTTEERDAALASALMPGRTGLQLLRVGVLVCLGAHIFTEYTLENTLATQAYLAASTALHHAGPHLFVVAFKHILDDRLCNTKPNSVSGHMHFYVFYAMALPRLAIEGHRLQRPAHTRVWVAGYACWLLVAVVMAYRTAFMGFHTPRQVVCGVALSVLSVVWYTRAADLECGAVGGTRGVLHRRGGAVAAVGAVAALLAAPFARCVGGLCLAACAYGLAWAAHRVRGRTCLPRAAV